jgi:hypothetical protein
MYVNIHWHEIIQHNSNIPCYWNCAGHAQLLVGRSWPCSEIALTLPQATEPKYEIYCTYYIQYNFLFNIHICHLF